MALKSRIAGMATVALVVAGCAGEQAAPSSTSSLSTSSTTVEPSITTVPVTTTVDTTTTTGVPATTNTSVSATTTVELPPFPPARTDLEHGGDTWVVVLAASEDPESPDLRTAEGAAGDAGYTTGLTDCDFGAATVLGLAEEEGHFYTVSVYLRSEADAEAALVAFRARGVDGAVGQVQTFCMD